jgi:Tol biopolymer transport system component
MALSPGARLGPYEIQSPLGAGGMGEVYRARDTRLDRTVAIKILPQALAADAQFRDRFDREARTISQLDHPHICALYDVGEQDGTAYLVMQYLEGETLETRLKKGALPLDQALQCAIQVADALDKAHRAGVVHRDLKPGNILLTRTGAKLLDFGLAKTTWAVNAGVGATMIPTSPNLTAQGTILGTLPYMAPEQLDGRNADARTDVFAFGAIVYEMVAGRKAFEAKSHASLIAAILEHDPPAIASLQPLAPQALNHLVAKCLAKDPDDRWQSARDVMSELKWVAVDSGPHGNAVAAAAPPTRRRGPRVSVFIAGSAGLAIGALAASLIVGRVERGPSADVARAVINTAPAERLQALAADATTNEGRPSRTAIAWSPDGRSIVFSAAQGGRQQLYLRALDRLDAASVAGTDAASNPFFSPDGRWLGFWSNDALRKVAVAGGPATTICEAPGSIFGASWGSDDMIVYSRARQGLWRVPGAGGTPQRLTTPNTGKGEVKHLLPQVLPGNQTVLFTVTHTPLPTWNDTEIVAQSLTTGQQRVVVQSGADARYVASGHLLYMQRGTLMAAPFDVQRVQIRGGGIGVVADVMQAANTLNEAFDSGAGQFAVSESGSLLYAPGGVFPDPERSLVWVNRAGLVEPLPAPVRPYLSPRLSPDGQRIATWTTGDRNLWTYDLSRRSLTRLTSEGRNARPIWTPDGKRIVFGSANAGDENLFWKAADGSGTTERLTTCDCLSVAASWSPDGRTLVFYENKTGTNGDIFALSVTDDRQRRPLVQSRFTEAYPDVSSDGRWLAYVSDESGRAEVYVQPFAGPGPRHQVSAEGGSAPAWSRDGRELFYVTATTTGGQASLTKMIVVPVTLGATFTAGTPHVLFEGRYGASAIIRGYDVTSDGRRFLMVQQKERPPTVVAQMILVQHWFEELKRLVPTK